MSSPAGTSLRELPLRILPAQLLATRGGALGGRGSSRLIERHVLPLVESGRLRVLVAETFPLERVADAYARFAAGGKLGKIVLSAG